MRALILNSDYSLLSVTPTWYSSLKLVFKGCVTPLANYEKRVRAESQEFEVPAIAVLKNFVNVRRRRQSFTLPLHKNVFIRDKERCAYCNSRLTLRTTTKDHVVPRCKGGKDDLLNVVASCRSCNGIKADRTLSESGLQLRSDVELRHLNDDEKLSVLLKTHDAVERRAWLDYFKKSGISIF